MLESIQNTTIKILTKIFGSRNDRIIRDLRFHAENITKIGETIAQLDDEQLRGKTTEFKTRLSEKESLDDILPEAFAVMREVADRRLGNWNVFKSEFNFDKTKLIHNQDIYNKTLEQLNDGVNSNDINLSASFYQEIKDLYPISVPPFRHRHFEVQLIAGMVLHNGDIAEMMTGEGKTLAATLPSYLNALNEKGVHVITVNDFLASRDADWMRPAYEFLGMNVGCITSDMDNEERVEAYACDITYGTNNEFGFDYLRDNMKMSAEEQCQKRRGFCIVDEVDSILIDEARTPLIISGPADDTPARYYDVDKVVRQLIVDKHFTVSEKDKSAILNEEGISECEKLFGIDNFYAGEHMDLPHLIENALRAHHIYAKNKDYVVQGGEVVIVDDFTGRLMAGRRWSDGLHQAIEAKENVEIKKENQTLATITFQNFFKLYDKLSGMTGTALTEAGEFASIYNLDVVQIPTNRKLVRMDKADLIFGSEREKMEAIAIDVKERNAKGQPVLVGTVAIERSEILSKLFTKHGIKHEVLNAKQHARENDIILKAGQKGAITIATNMAGRGTDIKLGEGVAELGGLYVIGSERHESRRIDNQLRGRSGRQGDVGESRFYLSLEDDLMRIFAGDWVRNFMQKMGLKDGEPIEANILSRQIEKAQKKVENHNFEIRKNLLEYDAVMNTQRTIIYEQRSEILAKKGLTEMIKSMLEKSVNRTISAFVPERKGQWDAKKLCEELKQRYDLDINHDEIKDLDRISIGQKIESLADEKLNKRRAEFGEIFDDVEQYVLLETFDTNWKDHLRNMDHLRDGINLRAMGGKDPKQEYKKEGFMLFDKMADNIRDRVSELIMKVEIASNQDMALQNHWDANDINHAEAQSIYAAAEQAAMMQAAAEAQARAQQAGESFTPNEEPIEPIINNEEKIGRNEPCPCGSGKKYKQCCGRN